MDTCLPQMEVQAVRPWDVDQEMDRGWDPCKDVAAGVEVAAG